MNVYILQDLGKFPFDPLKPEKFAQEVRDFQNYFVQKNVKYTHSLFHLLMNMIATDFPSLKFVDVCQVRGNNIELWYQYQEGNRAKWFGLIKSKYKEWGYSCRARIIMGSGFSNRQWVGIKIIFNWTSLITYDYEPLSHRSRATIVKIK